MNVSLGFAQDRPSPLSVALLECGFLHMVKVLCLCIVQFCMKLALSASFPKAYGGLDGRVIYIDVESKFSSRR